MPEGGILKERCENMNSSRIATLGTGKDLLQTKPIIACWYAVAQQFYSSSTSGRVLSQELSFENFISLLDELGHEQKMRQADTRHVSIGV